MKHVEAQQCIPADEPAAEQQKARIGAGVDERDITHLEKRRTGAFVTHERGSTSHVAAHRDGPDGKLVPRQQVAGEAQQQR